MTGTEDASFVFFAFHILPSAEEPGWKKKHDRLAPLQEGLD
jgi:hypothetical protein